MTRERSDEQAPLSGIPSRLAPYDFAAEIQAGTGGESQNAQVLRLEVASYIGQMCAELGTMARQADMALLSYFLEMAAAEARESCDRLGIELHRRIMAQDEART